jgi:hypothetical protein
MKFSTPLLLPLAIFTLALGACQKAPPPPDEAAIFSAVQENLRAMEQKNVEAVMATVHPQAAAYASTREMAQMMFEQVEVKYGLSDLKLVAATADEAKVSFKQSMEKTGGTGQFMDNIVHGLHILRLDHGKWKIHRTQALSVTGLDGKPLGAAEPPPSAPAAETPAATPTPPAPAPDAPIPPPLPGAVPPAAN